MSVNRHPDAPKTPLPPKRSCIGAGAFTARPLAPRGIDGQVAHGEVDGPVEHSELVAVAAEHRWLMAGGWLFAGGWLAGTGRRMFADDRKSEELLVVEHLFD